MKLWVSDTVVPEEDWAHVTTPRDAIEWLSSGIVVEVALDYDWVVKGQKVHLNYEGVGRYIASMDKKPVVRYISLNETLNKRMQGIVEGRG